MNIFYAIFIIFTSFAYSATIEWDHSIDYSKEKKVFLHAFSSLYYDLGAEALDLPDIRAALEEAIDHEIELAQTTPNIHWVRANEGEQTVGMIIFQTDHYPDEVYIRQMSVEPEFQRQGIGRQLIFSLFDQFPDTKKVVVITRKVNQPSTDFYHSIGFTNSSYIHEGYNPKHYFGMEWNR